MASFNTSSFPDSLAIAKEETLTIGSIDEIQVGTPLDSALPFYNAQ